VFVNQCLGRILNIKWLDKISIEDLQQRVKQTCIKQQIRKKKSCFIGHTLYKPQGAIERHALDYYTGIVRMQGRRADQELHGKEKQKGN
jgi:hypothetical protein